MIEISHTRNPNPEAAVAELADGFGALAPTGIVFFASSHYDAEALARAWSSRFADVPAIGCTTAGELRSGAMEKDSIVAIAFDAATVERFAVATISDAQTTGEALDVLSEGVGTDVRTADPGGYCGIVVHDGLAIMEETVMEQLSARSNLPFVGGSAGDDAKFERTYVFANGRAHTGASAVAVMKLAVPYRILKSQSFEVLDTTLTVTKADEARRTVLEFDGKPAVAAYAAALGLDAAETLPSRFRDSPLGLVLDDGEPYVRSPQQVDGDAVVFFCRISEGMQLHVLRSRDIVADTRRDLQAAMAEMGAVHGVINFHCILRTLELEDKRQCDAYGAVFSEVPTVGFSTYGESYVGHINQTSTMILLG